MNLCGDAGQIRAHLASPAPYNRIARILMTHNTACGIIPEATLQTSGLVSVCRGEKGDRGVYRLARRESGSVTAGCTGMERNSYLIHVPHLEDTERDALTSSGTVAGLCPVTEANQVFRIRGGAVEGSDAGIAVDNAWQAGQQRVRSSR